MIKGKNRFEALDAFRGIFAIAVAIMHLNIVGTITETQFIEGSGILVEFFFLLSGFVLMHAYRNSNISFCTFFSSRVRRLLPLHLFMIFVIFIIEVGKLFASYKGFTFSNEPFSSATDISNFIPNILLIQAWTEYTPLPSVNPPSWSISIELYLYCVFFLLYRKIGDKLIILSFIVPVLLLLHYYFDLDLIRSGVIRGGVCYFLGVFSYLVIYRLNITAPLNNNNKIWTVVEIFTVISIFYFVSLDVENKLIFAALIFSFSVIIFSFELGAVSAFLKTKYFQLLGKLSYSIYMTHFAIIYIYISIFMVAGKISNNNFSPFYDGSRYIDTGNWGLNNLIMLIIIISVILLSTWTYKNVELRFKK